MIVIMVWMILWVHAMHCIVRTAEHRTVLLGMIRESEPFLAIKQLNDMSGKFDNHLFRLFILRNPWKIYPLSLQPIIQQLM